MMLRKIALVSFTAFALGSAAAFAQTAPPAGAPPAGGPHPHHAHHFSRADMCLERAAHRAAHLAYLETRLDLTAAQKALFDKWREALAPAAEKARAACMERAAKPEAHPTIVERAAFFQKMLAAKAAALEAAQPALEALYNSLKPAQKAILDRPMGRFGHHFGHGWGHGGDKGMHGGGMHGRHHQPGDEQQPTPPKPTP